jgi:hypothetical protein
MYGFPLDRLEWRRARHEYMRAARATKELLTNPESYWKYSPDDERLQVAVEAWVDRARNAHKFFMGREPIIKNLIVIQNGESISGEAYAS